ncbi:MAG: PQQ-like beta-propeller repeat protein, partial [Planctomycetes bacterium]|nr:PQQ-like beta-propeller repeat protein [Planctomycetota bacterium]
NGHWLPFADRVLNALVLAEGSSVDETEVQRVLAPRGLLITPTNVTVMPVPEAIDDWGHYLYDASGNAVSKDTEVASPRSFRWNAPPRHFRSHNHSPSFTGLVSAGGRVFHFLDKGTFLFDKGGASQRWSLIARDAFNGGLLWKKVLEGYGQPFFEDVAGQAVRDFVWRTPLSMNRRLVAVGDRVFVALSYRGSALSILDAASGKVLHEVELGGVDEIVVDAGLAICRVRPHIPMPADEMKGQNAWAVGRKLEQEGFENPTEELRARVLDRLRAQTDERLAAVDAESGKVLWQRVAPRVAVQSLAMADGKVVYHNYEELVALDAKTGEPVWTYPCPVTERLRFGARNMLGNLLLTDGKVLWTSTTAGGGVCLELSDGKVLWKNERMGTTGGFGFPTAQRVIDGMIFRDMGSLRPDRLADGSRGDPIADLDGMLRRGHHIRCFPGKATERFLITPMRGAEFIDLHGDNHMVNDWLRGACSLGNLPANGLFYVTPDPCSCYAGARIYGFSALAPKEPAGLEAAPVPDDPTRLVRGPAYSDPTDLSDPPEPSAWSTYRAKAGRTARATCILSDRLSPLWTKKLGGDLTQATIAAGKAYVVRKDTYELYCLNLEKGETTWNRAFPAALDGPPTVVGDRLYLGSRDG